MDSNADKQLPLSTFNTVATQEDIYGNVKTFINHPVKDFDIEAQIDTSGDTIYRFLSDYDDDKLTPGLTRFLASDAANKAEGIIIGSWGGVDSDASPKAIYELLAQNAHRLPALKAFFLGDITSMENEMSWIEQADLSIILSAFPQLQLLRTRGGNSLSIQNPINHHLRALAIESGGLPVGVVRSICASEFPALEHLELWLGTEDYGADSSVQDLQPILSGALFPNLKYLGFRNCDYVDDIAAVVVNSPIIDRIETLDLSLGVLSDAGAKALLSLSGGGSLKHINIHHNYVSDELLDQLNKHPISIDTSNPNDMDTEDDWRYVAVGE